MPHMLVGKRRDEQYTVQASLSTLRDFIPPSYFTPQLALVTDGKAVGEAIRVTGPNLIYVRFPKNDSGFPVSFTLPRQFLIPVTCRKLARESSSNLAGMVRHNSGTSMTGAPPVSPSPQNGTFASSAFCAQSHNNKDNHAHVDLGQHLGNDGEPALCVVCGRWDEAKGEKRKSGHKCRECIGKKSMERLRREFNRLLESELNESDDEEIQTHH